MGGKFWDEGIQLVDGCDKVSPGCDNCWAEKMTARFKGRVPEVITDDCFNGKVKFNLDILKRKLKPVSRTSKVFAIFNDLYHDGITDEQIVQFYNELYKLKWDDRRKHKHTFLIITKRPERAADIVRRLWVTCFGEVILLKHENQKAIALAESTIKKFFPPIWHIVTAENQLCFMDRVDDLTCIPGNRGLIIEPMLEKIDLLVFVNDCGCGKCDFCLDFNFFDGQEIHQIILGAETGSGARPMNPEWARSIRDSCQEAGLPFYLKSLGDGKGRVLDGQTHDDLAWEMK